jgi:hypothetical protein
LWFLWLGCGYLERRRKRTLASLVCYWLVMLTWGVIDIRYYNHQIGGHGAPGGHLESSHDYFTWYFLPYRFIEP